MSHFFLSLHHTSSLGQTGCFKLGSSFLCNFHFCCVWFSVCFGSCRNQNCHSVSESLKIKHRLGSKKQISLEIQFLRNEPIPRFLQCQTQRKESVRWDHWSVARELGRVSCKVVVLCAHYVWVFVQRGAPRGVGCESAAKLIGS